MVRTEVYSQRSTGKRTHANSSKMVNLKKNLNEKDYSCNKNKTLKNLEIQVGFLKVETKLKSFDLIFKNWARDY